MAAHTMCLICAALGGKPVELECSNEVEEAFLVAKEALAHATMLAYPHADRPIGLTVDV